MDRSLLELGSTKVLATDTIQYQGLLPRTKKRHGKRTEPFYGHHMVNVDVPGPRWLHLNRPLEGKRCHGIPIITGDAGDCAKSGVMVLRSELAPVKVSRSQP